MSYTQYVQQPECQFQTQYNISVSDICSELSYFIVMPFPFKEKGNKNGKVRSTVITFRKDQTTFSQLMEKYKRSNPQEKRNKLAFFLSKGFQLPQKQNVKQLKRLLRKQNLDGLVLYSDYKDGQITMHDVEKENNDENESQISNECGLMELIESQSIYQSSHQFSFYFLIPKSLFVITVILNPSENISLMIDQFLQQMNKQFQCFLTLKDIKHFKLKSAKKLLNTKICIKDEKDLYDNSQIQVEFKNPNIKLIRNIPDSYILSINGIQSQTLVHLNYYQVKNMTLKYVYQRYFEQFYLKEPSQSNKVCLKIMDLIVLPDEKMNKLENAIQKLKQIGNVKLIGHLINEKMIFYSSVNILSDVKPFEISELKIPASSNYERKQCEKKINERLNEMEEEYFKIEKHIEPIMIYTSNLKYEDQETKQIHTIYDALNKFLREESILKKKIDELKKNWIYRYASTLLKHLEKLQCKEGIVYRGTNYDLEQSEGQTIIFKSFVSTSTNMDVSLGFALKDIVQNPNCDKNLYIMTVKRGRPIAKLSYYNTEEQYLLQPYTQFKITKSYPKKFQHPALKAQFYDFTVYEMQQIQSSRIVPKTINNYILWVDDKQNQGKEIFNKFIKEFLQSTALFQIKSTQQLKTWTKQKEAIIKDVNSNIIMITNMVRVQNGVKNFYAGAQSIQAIRTVLPDIPIAVYVRDIGAANNNLKQKKVSYHNLKVINQFEDFTKYVEQHVKIKFFDLTNKFQSNNPQLIKQLSEPIDLSQKSIKTTAQSKKKKQKKSQSQDGETESKCQIM